MFAKPFANYSVEDWLHLRPLTQGFKTWRYDAINAAHVRKRARQGDVSALRRALAGKRVLLTVAFEDAQAVDWQIRLVRRYVVCDLHVIADNSADETRADRVRTTAERGGARYVRLPAAQARASRGHGLALNWLWHNVVRPGRPHAFGFLDHDFFPTGPDDPFAALARQDFYGVVRAIDGRWFLWAGFCIFRFAAVADEPLDFRQDWFNGLDTGGANWSVLYRYADLARLAHAPMTQGPYRPDVSEQEAYFQWSNAWLHEVGSSGRPELKADKRAVVAALLKPHLDAAP